MAVLENIEPQKVFRFFEEICNIPHGSSNTWMISNYLVDFAKERQLDYIQDELGNVIITKKGTSGYETSEPVIIQGHMDMVCEKDSDCDIDFLHEGIRLRVDGNIIDAVGTTLGGDDGIAVAFALAILDAKDDEIQHPPLEVVITVDEEIGMLGAAGLDYSLLKSKVMLNIDSEEEGELLVSCAGGATAACHLPVNYENRSAVTYSLKVCGISGGHSGMEIIKQGANSNKVLGRLLYKLSEKAEINIISVNGGLKDNAIPRESICRLAIQNAEQGSSLEQLVGEFNDIIRHEYQHTDPDINVILTCDNDSIHSVECMTREATDRVIAFLMCAPNGVQRMSEEPKGLVQTSLNLGILSTNVGESGASCDTAEVVCSFSVRSSVSSEKEELISRLRCLTKGLLGHVEENGNYPAWEYKENSVLRGLMVEEFTKMYGYEPKVSSIHAGVECGLFANGLSGLDCVSYGPQMYDIHTTSERILIDSVRRTWEYTLNVLKRLKNGE